MAHNNHFNIDFNLHPPPSKETEVSIQQSSNPLRLTGLNLLVEVSNASSMLEQYRDKEKKTISLFAHLDTGASSTAIDERIASYLGLMEIGRSRMTTASGTQTASNYAVDIVFLNTKFKTIQNLKVSSCKLGSFNLDNVTKGLRNDYTNFGMLIGRDIMTLWNIIWNGPTSTVLISD